MFHNNPARSATRYRRLLLWLAASATLSVIPALAADASDQQPGVKATGAFVALVVTDLDGSLQWYQSTLGVHVIKRGRSPRVAATTVVLGGSNLFVELIHYDVPAPARAPLDDTHPLTPGILKAGMLLERRAFEALAQRTHAQIFDDREMKMRSFLIKDNEDNLLQAFTSDR